MKKKNILIIILFVFSCTTPDRPPRHIKQTRLLMDTFVEITVIHKNKQSAQQAIEAAFNEMQRIENLMSRYKKNSAISQLNKSAGKGTQKIDQEVYTVIQKATHYSEISQGKFDITVGVLMSKLWTFDEDYKGIPTKTAITKLLPLVDYRKISFEENSIVALKSEGMMIDVGGIAKGYAVDRGIAVLKKKGIQNALINAGGDLKAIGEREPNKPWRIGIQHPRSPSQILGVLEVNDRAIATSGDYQKYFEKDKKRYHHILNPKTGWPAKGSQSVTILAQNVMDADAIATAVFVMGPTDGLAFIETLPDVEGIIITSRGKKMLSSGTKIEFMSREN